MVSIEPTNVISQSAAISIVGLSCPKVTNVTFTSDAVTVPVFTIGSRIKTLLPSLSTAGTCVAKDCVHAGREMTLEIAMYTRQVVMKRKVMRPVGMSSFAGLTRI